MKSNNRKRSESNRPGAALERLKTKIKELLDIDDAELLALITEWSLRKSGGQFNSKTHSRKSNAVVEFSRSHITIDIFFKYLEVIGVDTAEITIKAKMKDGREIEATEGYTFRREESFTIET